MKQCGLKAHAYGMWSTQQIMHSVSNGAFATFKLNGASQRLPKGGNDYQTKLHAGWPNGATPLKALSAVAIALKSE